MQTKQLYTILCYYLKQSGVSFSKSRLKQLLYSHPEPDSLYAIVDSLDESGVENIVLRVNMDELQANGFPAIVHTKEKGGTFVVIDDVIEEKLQIYKDRVGHVIETMDDFSTTWSGIALYIAQKVLPEDDELKKTLQAERLLHFRTAITVLLGLAFIVTWCVSAVWSITIILLLVICFFGFAVSVLLVVHEFGESNRLLHKVCHLNRLTNCNAVLRSSASKLFGWLSMADIGLCYFAGCILSIILAGVTQHSIQTVSWLMALALCTFPYTVFSLCYQTFRIKKWCPLCIGVILTLWCEIALALYCWSGLQFVPVSPISVFSLLAGFSITAMVWAYVKPLWKGYNNSRNYEYRYLHLKHTSAVIRAMIEKEPVREMNFCANEIHLGKVDASLHITIILSLFCQPCEKDWNLIKLWLSSNSDFLWFTIRFHIGYGSHNVELKELIDTFSGIYFQYGHDAFCKALDGWYECRDIPEWKAKYGFNVFFSHESLFLKNASLEKSLSITYTPAVFIGERMLPSMYYLKDLECLLKEL